MINDQDKLYLINLKLDFWRERLQENNNAVLSLNDLGNQSKIEGRRMKMAVKRVAVIKW